MDQKALRRLMKARNLALTPAGRAEASARIFERLVRLPALDGAGTVGLFAALPDEPDTAAWLVQLAATGRRIVLPRVAGQTMDFYEWCPGPALAVQSAQLAQPAQLARPAQPAHPSHPAPDGAAAAASGCVQEPSAATGQQLRRGAFGILEPAPGARCCPPGELDCLVIPGTAFSREGARCGRGGGYYDRYLARPGFRARRIGVCYAHQLLDRLPAEPHDIPMEWVVTDAECIAPLRD